MELKDSENLMESFKKRPGKTICAIVVLLLFLSAIAYFTGYFGERGKRAVGLSREGLHLEQSTKDLLPERKKAETQPTINQHTEGNQAPAVNVAPSGKVIINYGAPNDRSTKE